jgi:hypothetical protein
MDLRWLVKNVTEIGFNFLAASSTIALLFLVL